MASTLSSVVLKNYTIQTTYTYLFVQTKILTLWVFKLGQLWTYQNLINLQLQLPQKIIEYLFDK